MNRVLDFVVGAVVALALVCWALLLVISGTQKRHLPPDDDDPKP